MIDKKQITNQILNSLFDQAFEMIANAKRVPIMDKVLIDESELANILDDLKDAIPKEIKNANQILDEQKKILNQANAEAHRIVESAKMDAENMLEKARVNSERMISQENVVMEAQRVAAEIRESAINFQKETEEQAQAYRSEVENNADEYALRVKKDALQYADDMLSYLGNNLQSALAGLNDNRSNVNSAMRAISVDPSATYSETTEEEE